MKIKFISLASGSSGNCYFLGTDRYGILVDAGIGIRTIKKTLKELGIGLDIIRAVFITHDHADHIKAVGHLGEKFGIPVYSTPEVHAGINKSYCMTEKLSTCVHYLHKGETMELEDFAITAFEVPHDGTDNVGYCINIDGKIFSFLTDLGHITPTAAEYICKANYLVLEANYDEEMLKMGPYPQYLKERIAGPNGHMSNRETADFLAENINESLKYIWLCQDFGRCSSCKSPCSASTSRQMRVFPALKGSFAQREILRLRQPSSSDSTPSCENAARYRQTAAKSCRVGSRHPASSQLSAPPARCFL